MRYCFTFAFLLITIIGNTQNNNRYSAPIFPDYNIYENIIYAEASPYTMNGNDEVAYYSFDFYEPVGDKATVRPLVLLFPDGDFIVGNKEQDEIVNWCKTLTEYGFTCACVNYRQGYDASYSQGINRAMYRGVQDARAAVRYFLEYQRTFKIDPSKIYLGGNKSGAVVALHTAYLDTEEERPRETYSFNSSRDLNCLDCSGNPFEHTIKIAGVLNMDGAIYNPQIMENNKDIHILNLHLDKNQIASNAGHLIGEDIVEGFPAKYGSNFLHHFLDSLNYPSRFELLAESAELGFGNADQQTETKVIVDFLNRI